MRAGSSLNGNLEFRRAGADDVERIVRFWNDAGASVGPTDQLDQVRLATEHPATVFVLAVTDEKIVGTLLGTFDGWRGNMYRLAVHPQWRRQGIARELVQQVEQVFRERGARRITALIEIDRPWAMEFWTAVGYPRDERIVRHVRMLD